VDKSIQHRNSIHITFTLLQSKKFKMSTPNINYAK
jgi:hypothetical protein